MNVLESVLKSSKDWNDKLLEESILNVLSHLAKEDFKAVELRLLVPYFTENLRIALTQGTGTATELSRKLTRDHEAFYRNVELESPKILMAVYSLLKAAISDNETLKEKFKDGPVFSMFTTEERKIYRNDWIRSIRAMFDGIKETIEDRAESSNKTHVIYIIDSSLMQHIDFSSEIPFANYILF